MICYISGRICIACKYNNSLSLSTTLSTNCTFLKKWKVALKKIYISFIYFYQNDNQIKWTNKQNPVPFDFRWIHTLLFYSLQYANIFLSIKWTRKLQTIAFRKYLIQIVSIRIKKITKTIIYRLPSFLLPITYLCTFMIDLVTFYYNF